MGAQLLLATLFASALTVQGTQRAQASASLSINPIRKVVSLLQAMQSKVEAEGKKETELYNKFMCYCQSSGDALKESMAAAEAKITALTSQLEAKEKNVASLKQALKQAQVDRSNAKAALQDGTAVREKEADEFANLKGESDANILALNKAIAAIEKGTAAFFQTSTASNLKALLRKTIPGLYDMDRQVLTSFLEGSQQSGYAPASGEIVGILKQLAGTMGSDLRDAEATEKAAVETYSGLVAAKNREIDALTAFIEEKMTAIGEASVAAVQFKNDLAATKESLTADLGFSADLAKGCDSKKAEWQTIVQTRSQELAALSETIKILSDDDALELFKKTLPGASALLQVDTSGSASAARALAFVQMAKEGASQRNHVGLRMISLALHGRKISFAKVLKMIDAMVKTLGQEQLDDDHKLEYCNHQIDFAKDKLKALSRTVSNEEAASTSGSDAISVLSQELDALADGLKKLDQSVAEATEQRKAEHTEFQNLMSSDSSAKALLEFAKNRLNKFYSPKLYKPAPKAELSAEDRLLVSQGGTPPPTEPAGGIAGTGIPAFVQIALHSQSAAAPPPPPETFGAYAKKSGEHTGVMAMMDLLIKDLEKEMKEASVDETQAQEDYEAVMRDAAAQHVADSKAITTKANAKAELEGDVQSHKEAGANAKAELLATSQFAADLHGECDWLLKYADARKNARDNEISNLENAKAVLSGAAYSL